MSLVCDLVEKQQMGYSLAEVQVMIQALLPTIAFLPLPGCLPNHLPVLRVGIVGRLVALVVQDGVYFYLFVSAFIYFRETF